MSCFPLKMAKRHQRCQITPSKNELCLKLKTLATRHKQMKMAYHELKSQINAGLLEAEEVFASLAIPLITLVGLKTREMAEEGRFTTIIIDNHYSQGRNINGLESQVASTGRVRKLDQEKDYAARATIAGQELLKKQQTNLLKLVHLLRQIEIQVNYCQDDIFETLSSHRASLHKLFQKAIYFVSTLHSQNHNIFFITLKLLQAIFKNVNAILGSVEGGVENLMQELAGKMCNPMVEYVKGLKDDMKNGTCVRLLAMVVEMERMIRDGRLELENVRKKVIVAEQVKFEATCKLKTIEEGMPRLKGHHSLPEAGHMEPYTEHKLLGIEEEQSQVDKLLWNLLKKKRKRQAPASPMAPEGLLFYDANNRHRKIGSARLSLDQRRIFRSIMRGIGSQTPCLNTWIPLGSSPSVAIQPAVSHK